MVARRRSRVPRRQRILFHLSLGELVRSACETQYGLSSTESRLEAVRELAELRLPVADTRTMKEQSVPSAEALCP